LARTCTYTTTFLTQIKLQDEAKSHAQLQLSLFVGTGELSALTLAGGGPVVSVALDELGVRELRALTLTGGGPVV
jgi:hypothetical protein